MKRNGLNRKRESSPSAWQQVKEIVKFAVSSPWLYFGVAFGAAMLLVGVGIDYRQTSGTTQRVVCNGVAFTIKVDRQYPPELVCDLITGKLCAGE